MAIYNTMQILMKILRAILSENQCLVYRFVLFNALNKQTKTNEKKNWESANSKMDSGRAL